MLDPSRTKFQITTERPLAAGVASFFDGMALVSDFTGTEEKAAVAAGALGEKFLGFAMIQVVNVIEVPVLETLTAPTADPAATVQVTLSHAAVQTATLKVFDGATEILSDAAPTALNDKFSVAGNVVTLGGLLMGRSLTFWYVYNPTVNEVLAKYHQAAINYDSQNGLLGQVSVGGGVGSEVYTDFWDPSYGRFVNGASVFLGPNGKLVATAQNGGAAIGTVIKAPLTNDNFLGFRIIANGL